MSPTPLHTAIGRGDFATLSASAGLLYSHLLVLLHRGPKRLTAAQLARLTYLGERSIHRHLSTLTRRGLITVQPVRLEHRHRWDGVYTLAP
jgi:DNA-binding MarR family transcriptional regulator